MDSCAGFGTFHSHGKHVQRFLVEGVLLGSTAHRYRIQHVPNGILDRVLFFLKDSKIQPQNLEVLPNMMNRMIEVRGRMDRVHHQMKRKVHDTANTGNIDFYKKITQTGTH